VGKDRVPGTTEIISPWEEQGGRRRDEVKIVGFALRHPYTVVEVLIIPNEGEPHAIT
jgi:hypothetical protein